MTSLTSPTAHSRSLVETLDARIPLVSRPALDRRVRQLMPCAAERQLWLLMLDVDDVQMPVMIPIGDLTIRSDVPDGEGIVDLLETLVDEFSPASFVFVAERPGPAPLSEDDRLWIVFLLALSSPIIRVRAVYLCHDDGTVGYDQADRDDLSLRRHQAVSASSADM